VAKDIKPKQEKVDMDTIAGLLGVSKTTVHYAIRNTGRLSDETRKRVLKMVDSMGYRPDGLARSFRRRRTDTLGVVLVTLTNSIHAHLLEGAEGVARQHQHTVLVSCSHGRSDVERELVEVFLEKGVDGIIVVPADPLINREYYEGLIEQGVRLAFVDREIPGLNADLISTDHERGGFLEAHHLLKLGRKNLVCVATRVPQHRSTSVRERLQGIDRALREAGLGPATVLGTDSPDFAVHEQYGYDVMRDYLNHAAGRFDSVCAAHDGLAYGVIRALAEAGFRVPKDVAVVGFDDQDPSAYFQPPLTTVRQPMREIGMEAARLLFRRLSEPNMAATRQRIVLEPTLIVRESSGVPKTK
jgi:LacI family transcriptional regulator